MPPPKGPRLFLIDGYALIYRAFFAFGAQQLTSSRGENTTIAHGAHEFLRRLIAAHRPEYLGWVHDAGLSFRHKTFPDYKATRERLDPEQQADFDTGIERFSQILDAYHIPVLVLDGYEADDVIGTLACQAADQHLNTVVVSGDKDFMQLVRPGVWILNPWHGRPGRTAEKWYDEENAAERLGVPPERVTDFLALVGDTSDNVPGVTGIGEKTAVELVTRWGSVDSILAHLDDVSPARARNALGAHAAEARLSKDLVTIRTDLPITLDLDELKVREPDWNRLRELFVALEFRVLAQEAAARAGAPAGAADTDTAAPPRPATQYHLVDSVAELNTVISAARRAPYVAIDTETVLEPGAPPVVTPIRSNLVGLAIAVGSGVAYYLPFAHREPDPQQGALAIAGAALATARRDPVRNLPPPDAPELAPLRDLLADVSVPKTAHNVKFDLLVLRRAGITLGGVDFDSMLASYVLDPGRRSHALDALSVELLQRPIPSYAELAGRGKQEIPFDRVPITAARDYSCADADVAVELRRVLEPAVDRAGARELLREIELPLVEVLAEMEWHGIAVDVPWLHSLKARFARERAAVERAIYEAAGEEFNINSSRQLARVLFERLALPVKKRTPTGPSTDASVLQDLADEGHALPALLMDYRELAKLESTYLDTLPALVNPRTGRLHTSFNQTVASTGRLASSDPNLQNIPVRRELGREIRRGFVPERGWTMLAADYSQIELRLLAHLSHDPAFVRAFAAGGDIHRQTASIIFGVEPEAVTAEMRARAKTINFATIYGQGAHALSRQLKIEHAEARAFIDTYFERFAGVRAWLDRTVALARERGYVETIFKRRRYIPELADRNFNIRAFGERTAQNSPIQGSAADLIKVAMIRIHHRLQEQRLQSRMLLQVHDELVFECPPRERDTLRELVSHEMTSAVALDVPLVVDVGEGANWLEAKS
jgi:DNA polymerase-1